MRIKETLFLLLTLAVTTSACASDNWRTRVGLPEDCTNPVFTQPFRMHSSSRVQGAGICMNDGEAYTNRGCGFSSDWHYEPKLPLCDEEKAALPRIMGMFFNEVTNARALEPLKFCVVTHHGCGAVVVYRAFDNYRYSNIQSDNLEQFIAVYDDKGTLTDAMMMGFEGFLPEILKIEPHKDYKSSDMGTQNLKFDNTGEHFTINLYAYLKEAGDGMPSKVEMMRYYTITPAGKIRLDKVTNNSENYNGKSSLTPGAPFGDVANADAINMLEMVLTPMSDPQVLSRLDKCYSTLLNNEQLEKRLMHLGMMVYNRDPKAFLDYTYKNQATTSLVELLKRAKAHEGSGAEYGDNLTMTIEKFASSEKVKKWFFKTLKQ